jgi:hypothetical protein
MTQRFSWGLGLAILLCCLLARPAQAQLPVIDVANLTQTTITAIQTVLIVVNQLLELAGLDAIEIQDGLYDSDMADLAAIATEGTALIGDIASLNAQVTALFDLTTAPSTSTDLAQRLHDIRAAVYQIRSYAIRTQGLIRTLNNTVTHMQMLVGNIANYLGGNQGRMSLNEQMAEANKASAVLSAQTAALGNEAVISKMEEPLMIESWLLIKQNVMAGY